ncbi:MAG: TerB family tellurite resistance protein [Deltaproteobacteria bacterium]|nr:TerB family tellurite resistance protein [Deltaproteobacteria bacterium]
MSFDPSTMLGKIDADQLEALVETMYLAADADGEFSPSELQQLAESIRALARNSEHQAALAGDNLTALLERASAELGRDGREARLAAVRSRLGEEGARKAAFGLAVMVTAADGIMRTSEREFILDLAEALDLDRDDAADAVRELTRG